MEEGIGYRDYSQWRVRTEGIKNSLLETPGYERYAIYFGRTHLKDFETGFLSRSLLKIGKAKYVNTVQRGRNQGGSSFRAYAEITMESEEAIADAEVIAKRIFNHMHIHGDEGQTELYMFQDVDVPNIANRLANEIAKTTNHPVKDVLTFMGGNVLSRIAAPTPVVSGTFDTIFDWT